MLVVVICAGLLYALPNIYGEDLAIQISGSNNTTIVDAKTQKQVEKIINDNEIPVKSIVFENKSILIRVASSDIQLKAKDLLTQDLGDNYIVALNLAATTPSWLSAIGAEPMKLGLDLRGGVHFLMEVDMTTAIDKLLDVAMDALRSDFKTNKIDLSGLSKNDKQQIIASFNSTDARNAAIARLSLITDYQIVTQSEKQLVIAMSDSRIQRAKSDAVAQNTTILRNRINQLGVSEPIVQRQGADRIVVELPGIQDTALAKKIIGATATLEFRQVNPAGNYLINDIITNKARVPYGSEVKFTTNGEPILLYKNVILTGDHIIDSSYSRVSKLNGKDDYQVSIKLDSEGGKKMLAFTQKNIDKPMATLFVEYKDSGKVDSEGRAILEKQEHIINYATIRDVFSNNFQVSGLRDFDEAKQLSLLLKAGALIAPIQIVEELTIGPSMGQENIIQGLESCIWGLLISVVFMLVVYRLFGLFASLALVANLILIVGVMSLMPGATLSMPGIAGIVLTVGMAVDANVLINERIKEELRNGRGVQHAINEGYAGAWSSIFDANITTLITAVILYAVGTGSIKGFAITLGIGILTSMFTSIVGTRALANLVYGGRRIDKLSI